MSWEYCVILSHGRERNIQVMVATDRGPVRFEDYAQGQSAMEPLFNRLMKVMARLGADGWQTSHSDEIELWFKRPYGQQR